ncbi:MAG: hypothetical protein JJ979_09755 [Roseibium sp.]|nr:hypothetical protein [Roseibium sp.]
MTTEYDRQRDIEAEGQRAAIFHASRKEKRIAGRTLNEWRELARRDDCFERMVPSDLRQLIAAIPS